MAASLPPSRDHAISNFCMQRFVTEPTQQHGFQADGQLTTCSVNGVLMGGCMQVLQSTTLASPKDLSDSACSVCNIFESKGISLRRHGSRLQLDILTSSCRFLCSPIPEASPSSM
ncbi:hypothetical protein MPSEU_000676200 [Mayamaea pseudoterrestris]|nr:hypothetical protein MPSEU_000676200 [Mayamaea pseudoterrestris]